MYNIKTLVAAASIAVATAAGVSGAAAAPWDHDPVIRHDRPPVMRERVFDTLRFHHYRGIGAPLFIHGHYVVRSYDPLGHIVFVEVNPYTGAFIGEFRA